MRLLPIQLLCGFGVAISGLRAARADNIELRHNYTGTIDYLFTGQPLTDNTGQVDGVNCLEPNATLVVDANMIPVGATLVSAQLYVAGSLIGNDGLDYPPAEQIFPTANSSSADNAQDLPGLNALARQWATVKVNLTPPGATAPVTVSTANANAYVSVYYIGSGAEAGNVGFFSTPIDITAALTQGGGNITGAYQVGGVIADVCNGLEAVCGVSTCSSISALHTNGTASFGLLLIYEDPALPLRTVSVFEGLENLFSNNVTVQLVNGGAVSDPPAGTLTYFVVEGDLSISGADPAGTCGGAEYVTVASVPPGAQAPLCLNDNDNPPGNIFNGTINTLPAGANPPAGCTGAHLCGLAGVDIDRYDISGALAAQADEIDVQVSTGSDRVGAAVLVLGVNVYAPLLQADSQFRIFGADGNQAHVGGPLTYVLAISNTGNLDATNVSTNVVMPAGVQNITILDVPAGAVTSFNPTGGTHQNGNLTVSGLTVEVGQVQEIRFAFNTDCSLDGNTLEVGATLNGNQMSAFNVQAPSLEVTGPGVLACLGTDPDGGLARLDPVPSLSGGGCAAAFGSRGSQTAGWAALAVWAWARRRSGARARRRRPVTGRVRHSGAFLVLAAATTLAGGCGSRHESITPQSHALTSTDHLPGTACPQPLMAEVTTAGGNTFCIDRFEATLGGGALGNTRQSADDTSLQGDGSTLAVATVALGAAPAAEVSWYQAQAACINAHKRLCTAVEWERACRGAAGNAFPYGSTYNEQTCNGYFQFNATNPAPTGSFAACVSASGAYDLSGNVEEWLADAVPSSPTTTPLADRLTHGGSYNANASALACAGTQAHASPNSAASDRGFRCCADTQ